MRTKILHKVITCIVIMLIVSLPLNSLAANAQISRFWIKGERSNVDNYLAENERMVFSALVNVPYTTDVKDMLYIPGLLTTFSECQGGVGESSCKFTSPSTGGVGFVWNPSFIKTDKANIILYKDKTRAAELDREEAEYTFDNNPPEFSKKPVLTENNKKYTLSYGVIDRACPSGKTCPEFSGKCSGLKNITFYKTDTTEANLIGKTDLQSAGACNSEAAGSFELPEKFANGQDVLTDGLNIIIILLADRVGHSAEERISKILDKAPPAVKDSTFKLFRGGTELNQRSGKQMQGVRIDVEFTADDVRIASITSPDLGISSQTLACTGKICSSPELTLTVTKEQIEAFVMAEDASGNSIGGQGLKITKAFTLDNQLAVDSILINGQQTQYAKSSGNSIKVIFNEATGIIGSDVKLNQIAANPVCAKVKDDSKYECAWQNAGLSQGKLTLEASTKDILGNPVDAGSNKEIDVVIDNTPPEVLNAEQDIIIKPAGAGLGDFIKAGSNTVSVYVKEDNALTAVPDFKRFSSIKEPKTCNPANDPKYPGFKLCQWTVTFSNPGEDTISFTFTDGAGNKNTAPVQKTISVSGAAPGQPNFWKIREKTCSPQNLDRGAAAVVPGGLKSYCTVKLEPDDTLLGDASKDASTLRTASIGLKNGRCESAKGIVKSAELIRGTPGSTEPVIIININDKQQLPEENETIVTCTLNIYSRILNTATNTYEVNDAAEEEVVELKLGLFELPNPAQAIRDKVEREKESIRKWHDKLEPYRKLILFFQRICLFFNTFYKIVETLIRVAKILNATHAAAQIAKIFGIDVDPMFEGVKGAVCHAEQTAQDSTNKLIRVMGKFCAYVTCDKALWGNNILELLSKVPLTKAMASAPTTINDLSEALCLPGNPNCQAATPEEKAAGKKAAEANNRDVTIDPPNNLAKFIDPQDSIIASILFGCGPGIIYNADKYIQLRCRYVSCLEQFTAQGMDPSNCEQIKNQQTCKYVIGQFFFLVPPVQILRHYQKLLRQVLLNPFAIGTLGAKLVFGGMCRNFCDKQDVPRGFAYYACQIGKTMDLTAQISAVTRQANDQIQHFGELTEGLSKEPCRELGIIGD